MKLYFKLLVLTLACLPYFVFADDQQALDCSPKTLNEGSICAVHNLKQIHAAQFNYGQQYVNAWAAKHRQDSIAEYQQYLNTHPFPVVLGPDQKIYLADGHHRLMASETLSQQELHQYTFYLKVIKKFKADNSNAATNNFWTWMNKTNNVWLKDHGQEKSWQQLPTSIEKLTNDKYRTIAGWLMEAGWCYDARAESKVNYIEFFWADYFRNLAKAGKIKEYTDPNPTTVTGKKAVQAYLEYIKSTQLCHAPAAKDLPGYCTKDVGCSGN